MSSKAHEALKADLPPSTWGKILAATPIVMTVIATLLAGLSSSEMVKAQYDRSLAAQIQSKAGDQWNYFQAKRLRAALQRNTLDILRGQAAVHALDAAALATRFAGSPTQKLLESDAGRLTVQTLTTEKLPTAGPAPTLSAPVAAVLDASEAGQSEAEITTLLSAVKPTDLSAALIDASAHVRAFDAALKPVNQTIDAIERDFAHAPATGGASADSLARDFSVARLAYAAQRYDTESRNNQVIAQLYEVQVRKSNVAAERHHERSTQFFYGMLIAQIAVIGATLAMARKQANRLWTVAAGAGLIALCFAVYVYFFV